jgi:hypothetical protein
MGGKKATTSEEKTDVKKDETVDKEEVEEVETPAQKPEEVSA